MARHMTNAGSGTRIKASANNGTCVYCSAGGVDLEFQGTVKASLAAGEEWSCHYGNGAQLELVATAANTTAGFI